MPRAEALPLPVPAENDATAHHRKDTPEIRWQEADETYPADRAFHAALARFSGGISPIALLLAYADWLAHLAAGRIEVK